MTEDSLVMVKPESFLQSVVSPLIIACFPFVSPSFNEDHDNAVASVLAEKEEVRTTTRRSPRTN